MQTVLLPITCNAQPSHLLSIDYLDIACDEIKVVWPPSSAALPTFEQQCAWADAWIEELEQAQAAA